MRLPRVPRVVRTLIPAFAVVIIGALLFITIYFTLLDWQWVAFLSGILFSALLALASRASKAEWIIARRTAQLNQLRDRLVQETAARKRSEEACRISEEKMRLFSDAMPAMLVYIDAAQHYVFHNRAYRDWIGLRNIQIDGQLMSDVLSPGIYAEIQDKVVKVLSGKPVSYERTQNMASGAVYRLQVTYLPHLNEAGTVIGFFGILNDITERVHLKASAAIPNADIAAGRDLGGRPLVETDTSGQALYFSSMTEQLTGWSNPEDRLRQALDGDEFRLYYQKIATVAKGATPPRPYYEILIRLQEEEDNIIPPGAFIPIAEHFNMTAQLDHWVVRNVIAWHHRHRRNTAHWQSSMYCINLFASSISDPGFGAYVQKMLAADEVPPQVLCFEINEAEALEQFAAVARLTADLRRIGCRIALGGFGGDKVSFDMLKNLSVNFLKIDGSLIRDIENNPVNLAKIKAISRVSKVIDVRTIAQFVESDEMLKKLAEFGIDYAQGFGISRPQPIDQLT